MRPYVTIKFAQSLDGKIAAGRGRRSRISSPAALRFAHKLRAKHDAVLVGAGTVRSDNPRLTTRLVKGKNPARIILDSRLRTSPVPGTRVVANAGRERVFIFTTKKAPKTKARALEARGAEVIKVPASKTGNIDLPQILRILYKKGIKKLLVEGGSEIITSFIKERLADRVMVIIAPVIFAKGVPAAKIPARFTLKKVKKFGKDIVCEFIP